jgi:NarL family two-component system response regulator LiaR
MENLTKAEKLVYNILLKGKLDKEIADLLSISLNTVKKHNKSIYRKLKVRNRLEAILVNQQIS